MQERQSAQRLQPMDQHPIFAALITALTFALIILPLLIWPVLADMDLIARPALPGAFVIMLVTQIGLAGLGYRLFSGRPYTFAPVAIVVLTGVGLSLISWVLGAGLTVMVLSLLTSLIIAEIMRYLIWIGGGDFMSREGQTVSEPIKLRAD